MEKPSTSSYKWIQMVESQSVSDLLNGKIIYEWEDHLEHCLLPCLIISQKDAEKGRIL